MIDGVLELDLPQSGPRQTWSGPATPFVLGPENELLVAPLQRLLAGDDLAEAARLFNPFVLVGPTGSGKSQLAQAIVRHWRGMLQHSGGREALQHSGDEPSGVEYFTAADFGREFQAASAEQRLADWQAHVRNLKLFVIEDLERLRRRDPIQQELRHTIDAVIEGGGVVVITAHCEPAALTELDLGLRDRLSAGLLIRVQSPGPAAREAILRRAASARGALLDEQQLTRLAHREAASSAELQGRLISSGSLPLEGRAGEGGDVGTRVATESSREDDHAALKQIIAATARYFTITQAALTGPSRRTSLVLARNMVVHLARRHTTLSYADIGRALGGRDHTTIMHADRRLAQRLAQEPDIQQMLDELDRLVR